MNRRHSGPCQRCIVMIVSFQGWPVTKLQWPNFRNYVWSVNGVLPCMKSEMFQAPQTIPRLRCLLLFVMVLKVSEHQVKFSAPCIFLVHMYSNIRIHWDYLLQVLEGESKRELLSTMLLRKHWFSYKREPCQIVTAVQSLYNLLRELLFWLLVISRLESYYYREFCALILQHKSLSRSRR